MPLRDIYMNDPIFQACTRPAMLLSVPMIPLLSVSGLIFLVGMWANFFGLGMWLLLLEIPAYIGMRITVKYDDAMFNLLWLKLKCRSKNHNRHFYNSAVYSPIELKIRKD